jgi:hypothetical protein
VWRWLPFTGTGRQPWRAGQAEERCGRGVVQLGLESGAARLQDRDDGRGPRVGGCERWEAAWAALGHKAGWAS